MRYLTCAAFGMKDYPVPISTTNHLIIDLANLKSSPELVECTWLSEEVEWAKSAKEINISPQDFAESLMQQVKEGNIADKVSEETTFHVSPVADKLHPVFAGTSDEWMYPELQDLPNGYGGSSGSRTSGVESPDYEPTDNEAEADAAPLPQRPQVVSGPPAVLASDESPIVPIRRRLRGKQQDPATEATLKRIHDKLRSEKELYKLHLKHYHMKLDQFKKRTSQLKIPKHIYIFLKR